MGTTLGKTAGRVTGMPEHRVTADDSQFVGESRGPERYTPLQAAAQLMVFNNQGTNLFSMDTLYNAMHVPPIMFPATVAI